MKKYDICIVGAGPAGIFTAIELLRNGSKKKMCIIEKGQPVEKRVCPKTFGSECKNCKPYCHITTGFSGAGAFSDGKLSLSYEVGGELPQLIGADLAQSLIDYTDTIYLEFVRTSISKVSATRTRSRISAEKQFKRVSNSWIAPFVTLVPKRHTTCILQSKIIFAMPV